MRAHQLETFAIPGLVAAFTLLLGLVEARSAAACSLAPSSLFQQYSRHELVFLGTVREKAKAPDNAYTISIDERFKGGSTGEKAPATVDVAFDIRGQCGFDAPKPGARVLIFMNAGDVVSQTSGSRFIWSESAQAEPFLNPVWDEVILLRAMLKSGPIVADADTAIHLALEALLPLYGSSALKNKLPLVASFNKDGKLEAERVWTLRAKGGATLVQLHPWTGKVVRIEAPRRN